MYTNHNMLLIFWYVKKEYWILNKLHGFDSASLAES